MINVLYILHDTKLGGATRSLLELLNPIRMFVNPRVLVPDHGPVCDKLDDLGIPYHVFPFQAGYGLIGDTNQKKIDLNFYRNFHCASEISSFARDKGWDIQLVHSNSSATNVGAMIALMLRVPHIWHFREFMEEDFNCEIWDKSLQRELVEASERCIAISDCVKEKYERIYGVEFVRKYNGLDLDKYSAGIGCAGDDFSFYMAGFIQEGKGQTDAVKAINYLVNEKGLKAVRLHLVGYGDDRLVWTIRKYIKKHDLEDNIFLHGFKDDLSDIRNMCKFSLTCSKKEALGRSTIEAMLARKIVIGANTGGTREIIGDNARGILYDQGNEVSLANAMIKAMNMRISERTNLLEDASNYCIGAFNNNSYRDEIVELYRNTLENASKNELFKQQLLATLNERYNGIDFNRVLFDELHDESTNKYQEMFRISNTWLTKKIQGAGIEDALKEKGIKTIAIYGAGYLGRTLHEELESGDIEVEYIIDNGFVDVLNVFNIMKPSEDLPRVDCVVVTVVGQEMAICESIRNKLDCLSVGISDLVLGHFEKG